MKIKGLLRISKGYKWGIQKAAKKNKKKEPWGRMIIGIKKNTIKEIGEMKSEKGLITN